VVPFEEALELSRTKNLDLIQVTEKVQPPVCKIGDFGKYIYQQEKKERAIGKVKTSELKVIRLTFNISPHDMEIRAKLAEKFLKKGDRVRIELVLRGREKAFGDFAKEKMTKFLDLLQSLIPIKFEKEIKREVRGFTMIIAKG